MENFDFYISSDGYLVIPSSNIRYLIDYNESSIPSMPEAIEVAVRAAGRDGDIVLNTTYEPLPFIIVCYTEEGLTAQQKDLEETKINNFVNEMKIKNKTFAIEKSSKFYNVKYNSLLTTVNFPTFLKFSIPFKSSLSYAKDINEKNIIGNGTETSNTVEKVGAVFTINGPALNPIISLNDYIMQYDNTLLEGTKLIIDSNKSTITHINSEGTKTNAMRYYNHQFPKIIKGENKLKILSGIEDETQVEVKWNDLKF